MRAVLFFLVNRPDVSVCRIAKDIDPKYYELLKKAVAQGVEVLAYRAHATLEGINLGEEIPFTLR